MCENCKNHDSPGRGLMPNGDEPATLTTLATQPVSRKGSLMSTSSTRMLTINEVSDRLSVEPHHVYQLVYSGELPAVDVGRPDAKRRTLRIQQEDLERFIKRRTRKREDDEEEEEAEVPLSQRMTPGIRRRLEALGAL